MAWFAEHQRSLPWRCVSDPWPILLSEILLQQTQVSRGVVFWQRLFERYPTVQAMADSTEEEVLFLWQGAGYYSRARRLYLLSVLVCTPANDGGFDGRLPTSAKELESLPGIGPYTAAAVASIAHGEAVACVDGNVRRVMARQVAQTHPSNPAVQAWADASLWTKDAGNWNQAVMELGATVCTPQRPQCQRCPIQTSCQGMENPTDFPAPKVRKKKRLDLICIVRLDSNGQPHLEQRSTDGILAGMWGAELGEDLAVDSQEFIGEVRHVLSHRDLFVQVFRGVAERGIDPSTVPLSSLDVKILKLAGAL
jgi:A/G-specific adenine glycosylase